MPIERVAEGQFGLYDAVDNLWIGDDNGPFRYDDEIVARLVAEVTSRSLGWSATRIRARPYTGIVRQIRDAVPLIYPAGTVLRDIERGRLW